MNAMTDTDTAPAFAECFAKGHLPDLALMAATTVVGKGPEYQGVGRRMQRKLEELETEFLGKPFLNFYHAGTIVFIRREVDLEENIARFSRMWEEEADFLLANLNSRWLISASDTIMDVGNDETERALAMATSLFLNTVKLYETERMATEPKSEYTELIRTAPEMFDGVTAYSMGQGDMILKMLRRVGETASNSRIAGRILLEIVARVKDNDTVFKRFRAVHERDKTRW